jgi:quercetin dioxygenase-like cupin family protein
MPLLLMVLAATTSPQTTPLHLGAPFRLLEVTPIAELTRYPERHFNGAVRVEGVIASACRQEGCFIEVVSADGSGEGIVVNFSDETKLPPNSAGRRAVVEGTFFQKVYPASRVSHWQAHSFRQGRPVPAFSLIKRITAKAVEIGSEPGPVPPAGEIVPAVTERVDLEATEFEADGFGTGRKHLAPGEQTDRHSTGKVRELIFCLEGRVTVRLGEAAPIVLKPGVMTYIPPATEHELRNETTAPATYLFVFSRAPEPESKETAHSH